MLSEIQVKKLKPTEKSKQGRPDKYTDGAGLQLWVRQSGGKSWMLNYRWEGKQKSLTIGQYPAMGLKEARATAHQIKLDLDTGINPAKEKSTVPSFGEIAERWYTERQPYLAPSTHLRNYNMFKRDIEPAIGPTPIDKVTSPEVLAIGRAVQDRGATDMGRRAVQEVSHIYKFAKRLGMVSFNPASDLTPALKPHKSANHKRVDASELPQLLTDIENLSEVLARYALKFVAHTFLRTREVTNLEWSEIDWNARVIRISGERMKMDRPHLVPMSDQVLELLREIEALGWSDQYVFYNPVNCCPMHTNVMIRALWRLGWKGKMTTHGFRGVASTTLHEHGFMHEAIELQLAHDADDRVSKAYNGAKHLNYRTQMMQQWSEFVESAEAGNLIKMVPPSFK